MNERVSNPREKYDLLWELMEASVILGREIERLPNEPTIEKMQKAFDYRQQVYVKALTRLEVID